MQTSHVLKTFPLTQPSSEVDGGHVPTEQGSEPGQHGTGNGKEGLTQRQSKRPSQGNGLESNGQPVQEVRVQGQRHDTEPDRQASSVLRPVLRRISQCWWKESLSRDPKKTKQEQGHY